MGQAQQKTSAQVADIGVMRTRRAPVNELLAPWEEFRRVIPLVKLQSLMQWPQQKVPKVAILLCTMQAQRFLAEQLK